MRDLFIYLPPTAVYEFLKDKRLERMKTNNVFFAFKDASSRVLHA
jgi:hypothetical protein